MYDPKNYGIKKPESRPIYTRYGDVARSNVKWTYNFDPLRKWAAIIMSAILVAGLIIYLQQKTEKNAQTQVVKIKAEKTKIAWIEKRLETIKNETIAADQKRIELEELKKVEDKPVQKKQAGPKIYSWIDEKGNKIFSNKKPNG